MLELIKEYHQLIIVLSVLIGFAVFAHWISKESHEAAKLFMDRDDEEES